MAVSAFVALRRLGTAVWVESFNMELLRLAINLQPYPACGTHQAEDQPQKSVPNQHNRSVSPLSTTISILILSRRAKRTTHTMSRVTDR